MNKTVLLTGSCGFIGSRTATLLLESGDKVIGLDNMNDYYDRKMKEYRLKQLERFPNFSFIADDVRKKETVKKIFKQHKIEAVIHLAGMAGVRYSIENPALYLSTNAEGTLNILENMRLSKIKKLVFASTSSLYAGQKTPFVETLSVNTPISPYAASKKAAELMAYTYHFLHRIDVSIVRYFTVYGPAGRPDMSYFRFIKLIKEGKPIELYGDGSQSRDFTYVDDIAKGTISALKKIGYEILNLGGGNKPVTINNMIKEIETNLGIKAKILFKPANRADMQETQADTNKAKQMLGWEPDISFKEGMKRTIEWFENNQELVKNIKL